MTDALPIVICAFVAGLASAAPYAVGLSVSKKKRDGSILPLLCAACVSLVVIIVSVLIAYVAARDGIILFALVLLVVFLAATVLSVIMFGRKPRP